MEMNFVGRDHPSVLGDTASPLPLAAKFRVGSSSSSKLAAQTQLTIVVPPRSDIGKEPHVDADLPAIVYAYSDPSQKILGDEGSIEAGISVGDDLASGYGNELVFMKRQAHTERAEGGLATALAMGPSTSAVVTFPIAAAAIIKAVESGMEFSRIAALISGDEPDAESRLESNFMHLLQSVRLNHSLGLGSEYSVLSKTKLVSTVDELTVVGRASFGSWGSTFNPNADLFIETEFPAVDVLAAWDRAVEHEKSAPPPRRQMGRESPIFEDAALGVDAAAARRITNRKYSLSVDAGLPAPGDPEGSGQFDTGYRYWAEVYSRGLKGALPKIQPVNPALAQEIGRQIRLLQSPQDAMTDYSERASNTLSELRAGYAEGRALAAEAEVRVTAALEAFPTAAAIRAEVVSMGWPEPIELGLEKGSVAEFDTLQKMIGDMVKAKTILGRADAHQRSLVGSAATLSERREPFAGVLSVYYRPRFEPELRHPWLDNIPAALAVGDEFSARLTHLAEYIEMRGIESRLGVTHTFEQRDHSDPAEMHVKDVSSMANLKAPLSIMFNSGNLFMADPPTPIAAGRDPADAACLAWIQSGIAQHNGPTGTELDRLTAQFVDYSNIFLDDLRTHIAAGSSEPYTPPVELAWLTAVYRKGAFQQIKYVADVDKVKQADGSTVDTPVEHMVPLHLTADHIGSYYEQFPALVKKGAAELGDGDCEDSALMIEAFIRMLAQAKKSGIYIDAWKVMALWYAIGGLMLTRVRASRPGAYSVTDTVPNLHAAHMAFSVPGISPPPPAAL